MTTTAPYRNSLSYSLCKCSNHENNEILSRINWRGAPNNEDGEHQRLTINKYVKPVMESMGGLMIHHPDIRNINHSLYRDDGVHLNDTGYDIFNNNIGDTIRTVLLRLKM